MNPLDLALMSASRDGDLEAIEDLFARGACAIAQDATGMTALMWAAERGDARPLLAILPESDPDASDARGRTALMIAAHAGSAPCVAALLRAGADAQTQDASGARAVDHASAPRVKAQFEAHAINQSLRADQARPGKAKIRG